ncbi:MAG TPA: hypothetical protein VD863_06915 [Bradyrhizobium sp.]|nr:hypothetical protein [Bradyrhizobium sp.]
MTTTIKVTCYGNYVAEVTQDGREPVLVGPGSMVERSFTYPHPGPTSISIIERPATAEEAEAAKKPAA